MSDNKLNKINVKQAVPFFMVVNMEKSLDFYINGLGFELMNTWKPMGKIEWCWLRLGNASLMLQEYRNQVPAEKRGEGVSICFMCEDALEIYKTVLDKDLSTTAEPFVGNNLWVVGLTDPDGYIMYFESPTEQSEGTLYSEWLKMT